MDASHGGGVRFQSSAVRCEAWTDNGPSYKVIVNFVYPELAIAEQPDVLDRNVMENGEHVKLERVRPKGVTRRFEQYCCEPVGHEPVVK